MFEPGIVAVVTGAGSGVGRVTAQYLARAGAKVALVGRRRGKLEETRTLIEGEGGTAAVFSGDASGIEDVNRIHAAICERLGTAQVLINSAGVHGEFTLIRDSNPETWVRTMTINVVGPYLMTRAFMGGMIGRGWGRIVNVSSAAAFGGLGGMNTAYPLSKVTLNHFTRQLAAELAGTGVTANAIHPGEVKTEMWEHIRDDALSRGPEGEPMMAWVRLVDETGGDPPEKAAELIMDLMRPESDGVNGKFVWIKDGLQEPKPTW